VLVAPAAALPDGGGAALGARADAILADSESTRRDVIELLGVPAEQVFVIYPGAEPRFTPGPADDAETAAVLARYGIQRPYILSVGTLQPRKNYVRLIQAYAALRQEQRLPQELVIVGGRGWLTERSCRHRAAARRPGGVVWALLPTSICRRSTRPPTCSLPVAL
jgi:glycosyltransferase involved in cell wall biosynthesis